jgi:hypothetical protein
MNYSRDTIYTRDPVFWGEDYDILDPENVSKFIKIPYPQIMTLAEGKTADLAVLFELVWLQFEQGCNPVKYKKSRLSRYVRMRGLKLLVRKRWITVKQEYGKAPVVTLRWLKTDLCECRTQTRASAAQNPC